MGPVGYRRKKGKENGKGIKKNDKKTRFRVESRKANKSGGLFLRGVAVDEEMLLEGAARGGTDGLTHVRVGRGRARMVGMN